MEIFKSQGKQGLSDKKIDALLRKYKIDFALPEDYRAFLSFTDGLSYFEEGGFDLLSLETSIQSTKAFGLVDAEILIIGGYRNCLDLIFMDCKPSRGRVFLSAEGIEPIGPMDMSFREFVKVKLNCSEFL